ncbi:MAG: efflux RND transporter permease subunit, partial [Roseimicrobium sp.]
MQWLASISVRRPVFATVLVLVFVVVGILGYTRLEVDRFPKVDFPTVMVTTYMDGATPGEIETDITDKIEEAVNTVSGIDELHSTSSEWMSQVIIAFLLEKDADVAAQEVRDRVNRIFNDLPDNAETPRVEKMDPDATPVLNIALIADRPVREITEYADKVLRRQLESVAGVGQVTLLGGQKRQVNVQLDPVRLRAMNLTAVDVQSALQRQNIQIPAGTVKGGAVEASLRVVGKLDTIEGLERLVVRENKGSL